MALDTDILRWRTILVMATLPLLLTITMINANVVVDNGGYENIVVAIGERVPEDVYPQLLQRIQDEFTEASSFLFQATKNRLYFSNITILVPRSWTSFTAPDPIRSERFETSDFIIDQSQESRPDRPFTNKDSGCGQPGRYIHFTPTFIADTTEADKYGGYGKTIAHEWAHYRWGVFDETSRPGASTFYAASNGYYEATRCTLAIQGQAKATQSGKSDAECDPKSGKPPDHCEFDDTKNAVDDLLVRYSASLLYKQYLPKISNFCDTDTDSRTRHNREAPNLQNIHCFGKSVWQVMREHDDLDSQQIAADTDTTPTFRVVKPTVNYYVLVLDASGSMKGERLRQLRQAASNFINTAVQLHEQLAIITIYNNEASVVAPLQQITSQDTRDSLINSLPSDAAGITKIGQAIQLGRAQLKNKNIFGGRMLVITDGEETSAPFIVQITDLLTDTVITVDTIAIEQESAENLELLTRETGGQSFYHSGSSSTLDEAFKAFSERNRDTSDALITVFTKSVELSAGDSVNSDIIIDQSIGEDTQFLFDYSEGTSSVDGTLTTPSGSTISKGDAEYIEDTAFKQTRILIPETATAGSWRLYLTNSSPTSQNVNIIVQSRAAKNAAGFQQDPIRATATWGKESINIASGTVESNNQTLFVTVSKGYVPVLNAEVTASVNTPGGDLDQFIVTDDGLGADIQKNDGIYSAFLTEFNGEGRYGLSVMVTDPTQTAVVSPSTVLGQGAVIDPDFEGNEQDKLAGSFQRVVNAGSFTCEGALCSGTNDVFPPARILDLEANMLDPTKPEVTLEYTAPGDDLMTGTVSTYEIRRSKGNINILYDNFEGADLVATINGNQVQVARSRESYTISSGLEIGPHSYFFAIVAIDDSNHRSLVSNVASASMRFVPLPPGATTWTPPTTTTEFIPITTGSEPPSKKPTTAASTTSLMTTKKQDDINILVIAIAIAAPLIAILLAIFLLLCCLFCGCCKRKKKDKKKDGEANVEPIYGNVNDPNLENPPVETSVDGSRMAAVMVFPNGDVTPTRNARVRSYDHTGEPADMMTAAAEGSRTPTRNARVRSYDHTGEPANMTAAAEGSRTPTRNARVRSYDHTGEPANMLAAAEGSRTPTRTARIVSSDRTGAGTSDMALPMASAAEGSRTPLRTAKVISRTENVYDSDSDMEDPALYKERTRSAELVTQNDTTEPTPLAAKPDVEQNFYSDLPPKRTSNGRVPGTSGLRRDGTSYHNSQRENYSSDEEDEVSREKRRMKQMNVEEPKYY